MIIVFFLFPIFCTSWVRKENFSTAKTLLSIGNMWKSLKSKNHHHNQHVDSMIILLDAWFIREFCFCFVFVFSFNKNTRSFFFRTETVYNILVCGIWWFVCEKWEEKEEDIAKKKAKDNNCVRYIIIIKWWKTHWIQNGRGQLIGENNKKYILQKMCWWLWFCCCCRHRH